MLHLPSEYQFPKTDNRKFNHKWLNDYVWLEYSVSKNAVFCYACRQFSPTNERDNVFKCDGFSHWKSALESNKGFKKHQISGMHLNSMAKWSEAINRQKSNTSVTKMASGNVLQYRRSYVKKIIEVFSAFNIFNIFNIYYLLFINLLSKYFLRLLFFWLKMSWLFVARMISKNTWMKVYSKNYFYTRKKTTKIYANGNRICHIITHIDHRIFKMR